MITYLTEYNKTLSDKIISLETNNIIICARLSVLENNYCKKDDYDISFIEDRWKNTILSKCNLKIVFSDIKYKSLINYI